jgi:hypothetical protein
MNGPAAAAHVYGKIPILAENARITRARTALRVNAKDRKLVLWRGVIGAFRNRRAGH